jgi:hypothetical protein
MLLGDSHKDVLIPETANCRMASISDILRLTEAVPSHPLLSLHVPLLTMKLTLKRQLRPRPFSSVLGFLDLKTGVTVVVLFAVRTALLHPNSP